MISHAGYLGIVGCALALSMTAVDVQAQAMKPGLWETRTKVAGSPELERMRAEMDQRLAAMPPEQRKQMQQMMAAQGVGLGAGGETVLRQCITQGMLERVDKQGVPPDADPRCTYRNSTRRGNIMSFGFACTQPASSGEGTLTFKGDGAYETAMTMKHEREGRTEVVTMTSSSRYLGSDCGTVKPIAVPAQTPPPSPAGKKP